MIINTSDPVDLIITSTSLFDKEPVPKLQEKREESKGIIRTSCPDTKLPLSSLTTPEILPSPSVLMSLSTNSPPVVSTASTNSSCL
ncbi:unnamed protein product [Rhizophagus irregularis]|nr:unnamed protein product [Rhizophagus irregularis]